jgi:hypothetical protein
VSEARSGAIPTVATGEMANSPLSRLAGPFALAAGFLMIVSQIVWLFFDPDDHVATSQDVVFQSASVAYLVAFCLLILTLVAAYGWQARAAGRFGVVAIIIAIVGTMLLGGDLWFEAFAIPWIADGPAAERVLDGDPSTLLAIGAVTSYVLFALGWLFFGISSFRTRVFPKPICIAIMICGVIGFSSLLSPFGIPLGLAVAWLGIWMIRTTRAAGEIAASAPV